MSVPVTGLSAHSSSTGIRTRRASRRTGSAAQPAVIAAMEKAGVGVVGSTPAELARLLKSEIDLWGPVIKAAGIKSEE